MAAGTGDLGAATAAPPRARLVLDGRLLAGIVWGLIALFALFAVLWVLFLAPTTGKWATSFGSAVHDPKDFLITLLNGLTVAGLYFLVASGFTLVFGLMRVVNMAHGAFFLLGGYIALKIQRAQVGQGGSFGLTSDQVNTLHWLMPLVAATAIIAGAGLLLQQFFLRWTQGQELRQALITIALSIILADQMLAHFGGIAEDIAWPGSIDTFANLHVAGIQYTTTRLVILGISVTVGLLLWLWLKRTRTGMVIRAGVDDRAMVSALGINIQLTFATRLRGRLGARRHRRRDRRLVRQPRPRRRRELAALLARGRDHRRDGVARRGGDRLAPARAHDELLGCLPAGELHLLLDHLHVRAGRRDPRRSSARAVREAGLSRAVVTADRIVGIGAVVVALIAPLILSEYWVGNLLTEMLFLGIAAASLIFLAANAGMVSLAQVALYGIAGFVVGNVTTNGNTKGLNLGWNPWWGVLAGLAIATAVGLLFGALAVAQLRDLLPDDHPDVLRDRQPVLRRR